MKIFGAHPTNPTPTPTPKIETHPIELKIGTETNFGTQNSNMAMKINETHPNTPTPTPKIETRPIKLKIGTVTNFGTGNSNLTMKIFEIHPSTPHSHPNPQNWNSSNQAENWYRDQIWYVEFKYDNEKIWKSTVDHTHTPPL